jgi:hypothetical protein
MIMRILCPLAAALLLVAATASAQEPKSGLVDGDHKGCKYQLVVPPGFKKAEAASYSLYITFPPTAHQAKDYGHLWQSNKGSTPQLAV